LPFLEAGYVMAKCPSCGNEVGKALEVLKNDSFEVQTHKCDKCYHEFRVINHFR
jgi:uncharacterized Zn finger protein